ncbi:carbonic anhydrase family protein [Pendulispora brunnea]|uniref:Carbonic anhydrase n=1 Tax=Pendulispora brunnea TaxID=2905690 RepID=A0ABZ2KQS7_9BACT
MKRTLLLGVAVVLTSFVVVVAARSSIGKQDDGPRCESDDGTKGTWSHSQSDNQGGPNEWGELADGTGKVLYPDCAATTQQSPIAIPARTEVAKDAFALDNQHLKWLPAAPVKDVINNGHTWQANFAPGSKMLVDSKEYELVQVHFHSPSEHTLEGRSYPLEIHFVHVGPQGARPFASVVAVMAEEDAVDNPEFAKIWSSFNACPQKTPTAVSNVTLDLTKLLPEDRGYHRYDGSLTAPPCTASVRFHMLSHPIKVSAAQVKAFTRALGPTNRPIQPIVLGTEIEYATQN